MRGRPFNCVLNCFYFSPKDRWAPRPKLVPNLSQTCPKLVPNRGAKGSTSARRLPAQGRQEPTRAEKLSTDHRQGPRRVQIRPMQDPKKTARHRRGRARPHQIFQNEDASQLKVASLLRPIMSTQGSTKVGRLSGVLITFGKKYDKTIGFYYVFSRHPNRAPSTKNVYKQKHAFRARRSTIFFCFGLLRGTRYVEHRRFTTIILMFSTKMCVLCERRTMFQELEL